MYEIEGAHIFFRAENCILNSTKQSSIYMIYMYVHVHVHLLNSNVCNCVSSQYNEANVNF